MTGLTKDGQAVASTSYHLYGARKTSTDTTGNPFAYNGEARDDTGLDYLRARYYDSQGGTFLTEDSYPGEATDPLSQNRYSYVQNNPVNYTDPSGHRMIWAVDGSEPSRPRRINTRQQRFYQRSIVEQDSLGRAVSLREYTDHRIKTDRNFRAPESYYQAFGPNVATYQGGSYGGQSSYAYTQQQAARARAQAEQRRRQQIRYEYGLATGLQSLPIIREGLNLLRNWNTSLLNTLKHVCNPKTTKASDRGVNKTLSIADFRKYEDAARHGLRLDQKERIDRLTLEEYLKAPPMTPEENAYVSNVKFAKFNQENKATLPTIAAELIGWNNGERLVTGKDPLTGEDANRWEAGAELAVDIASNVYPIAKAGKLRKLEKALDAVDAVNDASKATKAADKAKDAARVVDKVKDSIPKINYSDLPANVQNSYKKYSDIKWEGNFKGQTEGTAAGKKFRNADNSLPNIDKHDSPITYKEFDVNNKLPSKGRDGERFVRGSDGSVYYTDDHYKTFKQIK